MPETPYEMVWRLYEGGESGDDTGECEGCGCLMDECTCAEDPRCTECERYPCICDEGEK